MRDPIATRRWRVLAWLVPAWYRERYASELLALHAQRLGRADGFRFWTNVTFDLLLTSLQLRLQGGHQPMPQSSDTHVRHRSTHHAARMAVRGLRKSPGFTLAVVLMLALGIGASVSMFSVLDRLLLQAPTYVTHADQVKRVFVYGPTPFGTGIDYTSSLTYPDYRALQNVEGFASIAAYDVTRYLIGRGAESEIGSVVLATGSYFPLLGVSPVRGRFFTSDDDQIGAAVPVGVISYRYWQRRFGGADSVIGKSLDIGDGRYTIVGVAPRGFTGVDLAHVDVWVPLHTAEGIKNGRDWVDEAGMYWLETIARVRDGVPLARIESEATARHHEVRPVAGRPTVAGQRGSDSKIVLGSVIAAAGPNAGQETIVAKLLGGVAAMVLLIACANVANLLLVRGVRRRKQFAVQCALGVTRGGLVAQVLAESTVLAAMAAVISWIGASLVAPALFHLLMPTADVPSIAGWRAALATFVLALVTSALAGLAPALRSSRVDMSEVLRSGHGSLRSSWMSRVLLGAQAALSVVLLIGAGLFVRSLREAQHRDLGVNRSTVSIVYNDPGVAEGAERIEYTALEALRRSPLVESAAITSMAPFNGMWGIYVDAPRPDSVPRGVNGAAFIAATEGYFATIGIPVLRGRVITAADDRADAEPVAVVNQVMAKRVWGDRDPIGKCLLIGRPKNNPPCTTVVGLVGDVRAGLSATTPQMTYYIAPHHPGIGSVPAQTLLVHVRGNARAALPVLRDVARSVVPNARYVNISIIGDQLEDEMRPWKLGATLLSIFSALALLVATGGLYSVLAFDVLQRRFELGLRAALGAGASRLLYAALAKTLVTAVAGVAVGGIASIFAARAAANLLYQTAPTQPAVYWSAAGILMLVAIAAAAAPAWRVTRADPRTVLREE